MQYFIIAPNGTPCEWTHAKSPGGAVAQLLCDLDCQELWAFAQRQGYRVSTGLRCGADVKLYHSAANKVMHAS